MKTRESGFDPQTQRATHGAALEKLIANRLTDELSELKTFSENKHEFRKNHSTLSALEDVAAEEKREKTLKTRGCCLVILIDINRAFNPMQ